MKWCISYRFWIGATVAIKRSRLLKIKIQSNIFYLVMAMAAKPSCCDRTAIFGPCTTPSSGSIEAKARTWLDSSFQKQVPVQGYSNDLDELSCPVPASASNVDHATILSCTILKHTLPILITLAFEENRAGRIPGMRIDASSVGPLG